jgi:hypothetical protein
MTVEQKLCTLQCFVIFYEVAADEVKKYF